MKRISLIIASLGVCFLSCGQTPRQSNANNMEQLQEIKQVNNQKTENKMKIEIWSDVMCPFCYIGKKKFETALAQFADKGHVEVEWKSFQLMPDLKPVPGKSLDDILVETKGMDRGQAKAMNARVTQIAKQVGLEYNLEKSIPANTFNAHRFTHFAKAHGKQGEAEEALFRAYFTDSRNIGDYAVLIELGKGIGLDTEALKTALENGSYADDVRKDIHEAQQIGVSGVPFFVFDRKQAVSGAQEPAAFLQVLESSFAEWRKNNPETKLNVIDGQVCTTDGQCD